LRRWERWEYLVRAPLKAWGLVTRGRYTLDYDFMPIEVSGMSLPARVNLLRAGLNLGYRRPRAWSWPFHMQVELTSYCNLRCPVCPVGAKELTRDPIPMAVDLFERLMVEAGPHLLTISLWAWGEPLLHPRLEQILRVARRYPAASLLSTNGQNLDDDRVQRALRQEPPTYLIVAIDGLTDETNSRFRIGAKLEPALEGVRQLAAWKKASGSQFPVLHCRFMVMEHNEHELPGLKDFAAGAGFDMVSVRTLSIIDADEGTHRSFVPKGSEWKAYSYSAGERKRRDDFVCQRAWTFPTVFADGTVVSCEQDYNGSAPFGVLSADSTFKSIWFGETASRIREQIRVAPRDFSFCCNCPYADRPVSSCSISGYSLR
jgi:MoaA/NifB/PqqE/SkfB family radical SAM enzyme